MAASPNQSDAELVAPSEPETPLSSVVYDMSQTIQGTLEEMIKMISVADQCAAEINEEIKKCRESAEERKRSLEEDKERFQNAAYTVLDLLNKKNN